MLCCRAACCLMNDPAPPTWSCSTPRVAVATDGVDATSANLVITPASGSTVQYDKLEVTACIKATNDNCKTAHCNAGAGAACTTTLTELTSGATYIAKAVVVKGGDTSLESTAVEFTVLYP